MILAIIEIQKEKIKTDINNKLWYDMTFNNDPNSKLLFGIIEATYDANEAYISIKYLR